MISMPERQSFGGEPDVMCQAIPNRVMNAPKLVDRTLSDQTQLPLENQLTNSRNFLLFMPPHDHDSQLHAVLSFYYSVVSVTPEGDSIVSEETLEGIGTDGFRSLFITLFGSLLRVAFPFDPPRTSESASIPPTTRRALDDSPISVENMAAAAAYPTFDDSAEELAESFSQHVGAGTPGQTSTGVLKQHKKYRLTDFVPDPGYFVAGAIAGGVSRTATAPLDRLKVYLLVNTSNTTSTAGVALKQGHPLAALKNASRPFSDAIRELFRSGGFRSFFAGELSVTALTTDRGFKYEAWHTNGI